MESESIPSGPAAAALRPPPPDPQRIVAINKALADRFRSQFPDPLRIPFDERMTVVAHPKEEQLAKDRAAQLDISGDVLREVQMYQTALENAKRAVLQLKKDDYSRILRPPDFYAQMFKDDQHMGQIKARFEREKKRVEQLEQKKDKAIQKRFSKQNRHKKNVESAAEKRKNLGAIEEWPNPKSPAHLSCGPYL